MANPLSQFLLYKIFSIKISGYDISFTNSALNMCIVAVLIILYICFSIRKMSIIPDKLQASVETLYSFISEMVINNIGHKGKKFAPFIFTTFLFILGCDIFGMFPYSFTVTSHFITNFVIATMLFILIIFYGFYKNGIKFLSIFLPNGTPWWMVPLMVLIELFSFLAKPFSLSLRLGANMIAGHVLIKVIAGFTVSLWILFKVLPLIAVVILIGFELFVCILQAYIFTILSCVYLRDAVDLH